MTVSSVTTKNSYSGDGSTTVFAYTFKIFAQADITVILRASTGTETVQTISTDYTVSGVGNTGGGNITFTTAPASTETVVLLRNTSQTQNTDYTPNDPFPAASHEDALDKLTFITQELEEELGRAIKISRTNTMTSTEFTVGSTDRQNKILAFDGSGELAVTQEIGTFRGDWSASTSYQARDLVKDTSTNNIFIANTAHTSSGAEPLTTNTDSAKWDLIVDAASASTSATNAASSATAAATSATSASTSATNAATSASTAETHKDDAETAKDAAETAQTAAETAQSAAESALDTFDDKFLGSKSADPTVDNDGDALTDGALYYNTTDDVMKVYDLGNTQWKQLTPTTSQQASIDTVATNISDVTTVAADETDIGTVAGISSDISTVAGVSANVTTVAGISANTTTVAGISANVTTVAGISSDVTTVAGKATEIGRLGTADAVSDMNTLGTAAIVSDMDTLADISSDISTVATNNANVTSVAGNATNINAVAGNATNINAVAGNATNINTVAGSDTNINTVATNITGVNSFAERYRVASADPTTSLDEGDLAYNTTSNELKYYNGTSWNAISPGITQVSEDTTPTLGGNLDVGGNSIVSASNGDITLNPNGTGNIVLDADVGIGTTSPAQQLHVSSSSAVVALMESTGSSAARLYFDNTGMTTAGDTQVWSQNNDLAINTGGSERMRIDSSGKVGIGTSSPSRNLHIKSGASREPVILLESSSGSASDVGIIFGETSENYAYRVGTDDTGNSFRITYKSGGIDPLPGTDDDRLVIDSSGNVGIGTTSPENLTNYKQLTVGDSSTQRGVINATDGTVKASVWTTNSSIARLGSRTNHPVTLEVNGSEKVRIDTSGNLGIGTTSPAAGLHIDNPSDAAIVAILDTDNTNSKMIFRNTSSTGNNIQIGADGTNLVSFTNGSERMRIDSSGNLLVGKTTTSSDTVGTTIWSGGYLNSTVDGDYVARFTRKTSDGAIVELKKNTTTIGLIGSEGGNSLVIGNQDVGILFSGGNDEIIPWNPTSNVARSGAIDLGRGTHRFQNLYLAGDIDMEDNDKILLGTGDDIQFFHSGSNSHITHSGTGALYIDANSGTYFRNAAGTEAYASFIQDGAVDLYHNGSKKFNTLSNGAVVYGWLYANEGIRHNNDDNTSINFAGDDVRIQTGGTVRMVVDNGGVTLGDTSNGKFTPVSGNYGSIEIDHGAHSGYEGYSIGGRVVLMHNNNLDGGIYNDNDDEWMVYTQNNGIVRLYNNGVGKLTTQSWGVEIHGNLYLEGENGGLKNNVGQGTTKMWLNVEQFSTHSAQDSYNVTSVTDAGTSQTTITIANDMNNTVYAVTGSCDYGSATYAQHQYHAEATGSVKVVNSPDQSKNFQDGQVGTAIFGDLA